MSSEDCKRYLKEVSCQNNWPVDIKWKRINKSKNGKMTVRTFESQYGQKLVVSEEDNIYSLINEDGTLKNQKVDLLELPEKLKNSLKNEKLFKGIIKTVIECPDSDDAYESHFFEDSFQYAMNKLVTTGSWELIEKEIKDYNYNVNGDDHIEIGSLLTHCMYNSDDNGFYEEIKSKKVGIDYDIENVMAYFCRKEGVEYIKLVMGGDWEMPVYAIIYWSEKDQKIKGFFPLNKGNTYNIKEKTAYGSETSSGIIIKKVKYNSPEYDKLETEFDKVREYFEENYDKVTKKAEIEGFKQWKKHLLNTEV